MKRTAWSPKAITERPGKDSAVSCPAAGRAGRRGSRIQIQLVLACRRPAGGRFRGTSGQHHGDQKIRRPQAHRRPDRRALPGSPAAWLANACNWCAAAFSPEARQFYERKKANTNPVIARNVLADKLARACFHMLKERKLFDVTRCFA